MIGDYEPEDAWDATDTLPVQLDNLVRRVELLTRRRLRTGGNDPAAVLEAIEQLILQARRRHLTQRELTRADQIDEDVAFIRGRL